MNKELLLGFSLGFGTGVAVCVSLVYSKRDKPQRTRSRPNSHANRRLTGNAITGNITSINDLEKSFFKGIDRKANLTPAQIQQLKDFLEASVGDHVQQLAATKSLEDILHLLRHLHLIESKRYRLILTILENSGIDVNIESLMFHVNGLQQAVSDMEDAILPRGFERDIFELDVLILHTEDDRIEAFGFRDHLVNHGGVGGLSVQLYEEFNLNKPLLSVLGHVLNWTRYVFVFMTKNMEEDTVQQFMTEMTLIESFQDERTKYRIVPVWTTKERLDVPIMNPFPGIRYWRYTDESQDFQQMYLIGLNKLLVEGRETITRVCDRQSSH